MSNFEQDSNVGCESKKLPFFLRYIFLWFASGGVASLLIDFSVFKPVVIIVLLLIPTFGLFGRISRTVIYSTGGFVGHDDKLFWLLMQKGSAVTRFFGIVYAASTVAIFVSIGIIVGLCAKWIGLFKDIGELL